MNKNLIVFCLLMVFTISLASAAITISQISSNTLGVYQQNQPLDLIQVCSNKTALCDLCNISNVKFPNSSVFIQNVEMQSAGNGDFNFTLRGNQTGVMGEYLVNGFCESGDEVTIFSYDLRINKTGEILSTAQGLIYVVFLGAALFLFTLSFYLSIKIPWLHVRDQEDKVVSVNDWKYVKIFMSAITYIMLMFIFGILYNLTDSFLFLTAASAFFYWLFRIMLSFLYPIIVFIFLILIFVFWDNVRKKLLLQRGILPD